MPPRTPSCCASPIRLHLTNTGESPRTSGVILRICSPSRKTREPLGRCGRGARGTVQAGCGIAWFAISIPATDESRHLSSAAHTEYRKADRKLKPYFCPGIYGSAPPEPPPPGFRIASLYRCLHLQVSSLALSGIHSHGGECCKTSRFWFTASQKGLLNASGTGITFGVMSLHF